MVYTLGMRRSGHHAVLDWVMAQLPGPQHHFNNELLTKPQFKWQASAKAAARVLSVNFEDVRVDRFAETRPESQSVYRRCERRCLGEIVRRIYLLVVRDPYNTFASRLSHPWFRKEARKRPDKYIRKWKDYARFYLGSPPFPGLLRINYNRWFVDAAYRRELSAELGLEFSDDGLHRIPRAGGGSSFDSYAHQGNAQAMDVLSRWRTVEHQPAFQAVLSDVDVRRLAERIFGPGGGIENPSGSQSD
jgi:hypothetical protein